MLARCMPPGLEQQPLVSASGSFADGWTRGAMVCQHDRVDGRSCVVSSVAGPGQIIKALISIPIQSCNICSTFRTRIRTSSKDLYSCVSIYIHINHINTYSCTDIHI